jgi:uncharacterized DUF497 family protein
MCAMASTGDQTSHSSCRLTRQTRSCRHGIAFADAEGVFHDPRALTTDDTFAIGEDRHVTIGLDAFARLLVVVYTIRGDTIRIISARRASARETTDYEKPL